jgi:hypothetical protein
MTRRRSSSTPSDTDDNIMMIKKRIENATEGLPSSSYTNCFKLLYNRVLPVSRENTFTICDYISSLRHQTT